MHKLKVNKAICDICGEILESKHSHDFVTCRCGNLSVDGGKKYLKRSFRTNKWHDLSKYEDRKDGEKNN